MNKLTWYKLSVLNLAIVALLGVVIRYNQVYYISFLDQKNLLHAHSHFAFSGWIGFLLSVFVIDNIIKGFEKAPMHWNRFLLISAITNVLMMLSFMAWGYNAVSISFSTFTIFLSYYYAYKVWKEINQSGEKSMISRWFVKASTVFLVLSSIGPFVLAYLTASHNTHSYYNHNALYWFLHFQYNGYFTFALLGLLVNNMEKLNCSSSYLKPFFLILTITCIPAYLLSMLTRQTYPAVTVVNMIVAALLVVAVFFFLLLIKNNMDALKKRYTSTARILVTVSLSAYTLKVILQAVTAHRVLSHLVFGYRPVVVGYLHLVFLVFISLFLLAELVRQNLLRTHTPTQRLFVMLFCVGVLINEALLALQGLAAVTSINMPDLFMHLLFNSALLFIAAVALSLNIFTSNIKITLKTI